MAICEVTQHGTFNKHVIIRYDGHRMTITPEFILKLRELQPGWANATKHNSQIIAEFNREYSTTTGSPNDPYETKLLINSHMRHVKDDADIPSFSSFVFTAYAYKWNRCVVISMTYNFIDSLWEYQLSTGHSEIPWDIIHCARYACYTMPVFVTYDKINIDFEFYANKPHLQIVQAEHDARYMSTLKTKFNYVPNPIHLSRELGLGPWHGYIALTYRFLHWMTEYKDIRIWSSLEQHIIPPIIDCFNTACFISWALSPHIARTMCCSDVTGSDPIRIILAYYNSFTDMDGIYVEYKIPKVVENVIKYFASTHRQSEPMGITWKGYTNFVVYEGAFIVPDYSIPSRLGRYRCLDLSSPSPPVVATPSSSHSSVLDCFKCWC